MIQAITFRNYSGDSIAINDDEMPASSFTTEVDVRYEEITKAKQDGIWPSWTYFGKRTIRAEGDILEDSSASYMAKRIQLLRTLVPQGRTNKMAGNLEIDFEGINETLYSECTLDGWPELPIEAGLVDRGSYQIAWRCPSPILRGELQSTTISMAFAITGRTYNKTYDRVYAAAPAGTNSKIITNAGNFYTFPIITFYGQVTSPEIILAQSDGTFLYMSLPGISIESGDYVVINFEDKTAQMSNGLDLYSYTFGSDWWTLQPGANSVITFADYSDSSAYAKVEWNNAYLI